MNNLFRFPLVPLSRDFDVFFGNGSEALPAWWDASSRSVPALNVWSDADAVHVEAEVPGLTLAQLEVSVAGDQLTLSGERPDLIEQGVTQHRCERTTGKFSRSLTLPYEVDAAKVEARLLNGVLSIDLPKAAGLRPRKIEIKS